jgi:hypothetical protein
VAQPHLRAKIAYYYALRLSARNVVANAMILRMRRTGQGGLWQPLVLSSINPEAIRQATEEWPRYYSAETHMGFTISWEQIYRKFSMRPSFFDLAVWQNIEGKQILQGLSIGRPSRGKKNLNLHYIERSFAPTYLKGGILLPVFACAQEYAKLLECERLVIRNPIDPAVYTRYGFKDYDPGHGTSGRFMSKEIEHGTARGIV